MGRSHVLVPLWCSPNHTRFSAPPASRVGSPSLTLPRATERLGSGAWEGPLETHLVIAPDTWPRAQRKGLAGSAPSVTACSPLPPASDLGRCPSASPGLTATTTTPSTGPVRNSISVCIL